MALVPLPLVKSALRVDYDDDDTNIELKIKQAEDIVLDFIQPKPDPAWTPENVPGRVSAAIILVVGYLLDDDSEEAQAALSGLAGGAPSAKNPVAALLWRLRTPTLA